MQKQKTKWTRDSNKSSNSPATPPSDSDNN